MDLGSDHLHGATLDGVLTVVIDRPERRNALTIEMYHGIKKAAVIAERDPDIDVLVLTGKGEHFCVGGEMGGKHEGGAAFDRETDGIDLLPFVQLERCPKIVLLAINGTCQGGGLVMTLMGDIAVVSERATFRVPELLRGVADCFYSARRFTAREALEMGLVSRVVSHGDLDAAVAETVQAIRETAPEARAAIKRDLNRQLPAIDFPMFTRSLASAEMREGFAAFVEKRPPRWVRRGD